MKWLIIQVVPNEALTQGGKLAPIVMRSVRFTKQVGDKYVETIEAELTQLGYKMGPLAGHLKDKWPCTAVAYLSDSRVITGQPLRTKATSTSMRLRLRLRPPPLPDSPLEEWPCRQTGNKFEIDGKHFMCTEIDGEAVDFKLGELVGEPGVLEFEDLKFLNEVHKTTKITNELLSEARHWACLGRTQDEAKPKPEVEQASLWAWVDEKGQISNKPWATGKLIYTTKAGAERRAKSDAKWFAKRDLKLVEYKPALPVAPCGYCKDDLNTPGQHCPHCGAC